MNIIRFSIFLTLLAAVPAALHGADGNSIHATEADSPADSIASVNTVAMPDSAMIIQELTQNVSKLNEQVTSLQTDLQAEKKNAAAMAEQNSSLQKALQAALPFAEQGLAAQREHLATDFDSIDHEYLSGVAETLNALAPYSPAVRKEAKTLDKFLRLSERYRSCTGFDEAPYSVTSVNGILTSLLDIADDGDGILNDRQTAQIDSLYIKAENYSKAVEAFDAIMQDIDTAIGDFRSNPDGDSISRIETAGVLEKNAERTGIINSYRYMAELYKKYIAELDKTPRSTTEDIRREIAAMLAGGNNAGNDGSNEK